MKICGIRTLRQNYKNLRKDCNARLQAQEATLSRIGMGGLGEDATFAQAEASLAGGVAAGAADRRGDAGGVAHADVIHKASEAEQVLQLLLQQVRGLQKLSPTQGLPILTTNHL